MTIFKRVNKTATSVLIGLVIIVCNFGIGSFIFDSKMRVCEIASDSYGYYQYLPALFIRKDIANHDGYGTPLPNGKSLNKYNYATALLEMPVFLVQYKIASFFNSPPPLYGAYYTKGILLSASIYLSLGLLMLGSYLKKKFGWYSTIVTLSLIYLGTNLLFYTTVEPGMSHVFSFFCVCGMVYFTERAIKNNRWQDHITNALFIALAVIIRPINLPIVLFFLFYEVYNFTDFKNRLVYFYKQIHIPFIYFFAFVLLFIPQIIYWKMLTGDFFVYSYGYSDERFIYWSSPRFLDVIFGVQCGWLPYTPIMAIPFIATFALVAKKKFNGLAIAVTMFFITYLCASWYSNFSCALGFRSFVEYYPLLSIPLAWFIKQYIADRNKIFMIVFCFLFLYINLTIVWNYILNAWFWCEDTWSWPKYWEAIDKMFF
jgi:hypothetical protein